MSRIGKKPIKIPEGVEVKIEKNKVTIKGPKGELSQEIRPEIKVELDNNEIKISPDKKQIKEVSHFWGLTRALLNNMVKGVTKGFEKKLEIKGVGFKASLEGDELVLKVGFSHLVKIKSYPKVKLEVNKNEILVSGIDKQKVGELAAKIKRVKPPEPYKGKGIRYKGEIIRIKVGKKAITAAS